jgi:hypothetical protein
MRQKAMVLSIVFLLVSGCSRKETDGDLRSGTASGSGGGSGSSEEVVAVSIKCMDGQDASRCMINWSNGQLTPAATQTIFGFDWKKVPQDAVAVTSVQFINQIFQPQCITLYNNGGVLLCGVLPSSQSNNDQGSLSGDSTSPVDGAGSSPSIGSSSDTSSGLSGTTETTQDLIKPFQVGDVKTYIQPGGSVYQQYFTYRVNAVPNGNIPKSLCLFVDGQPYNGVIGPIAAYPPDSSPKQSCINSTELTFSHKYPGDFGFDFSLKEYPGAVVGDRHEVSMRWEFDGSPAINTSPRTLVFLANGRWAWKS